MRGEILVSGNCRKLEQVVGNLQNFEMCSVLTVVGFGNELQNFSISDLGVQ